MQAIGGAEKLHDYVCDVERKQAEESFRGAPAYSLDITLPRFLHALCERCYPFERSTE